MKQLKQSIVTTVYCFFHEQISKIKKIFQNLNYINKKFQLKDLKIRFHASKTLKTLISEWLGTVKSSEEQKIEQFFNNNYLPQYIS